MLVQMASSQMWAFGSFGLCCEKRRGSSLRHAFNVITSVSGAAAFGCSQRLVIEWGRFAPNKYSLILSTGNLLVAQISRAG